MPARTVVPVCRLVPDPRRGALVAIVALLAALGGCVDGPPCPTCPPHTEPARAELPR